MILSVLMTIISALRLHQWLKNLLLFLPMLAAHQLNQALAWVSLGMAFFSFSLCASAVYIINDCVDLDHDRQHPRKKYRPFASGAMPIWVAKLLIPSLLSLSILLAMKISDAFLFWLVIYFLAACLYSFSLKRLLLLDCFALSALYTFRIIAGATASHHVVSFWLLAFSIFLFLSLAFVKRYAELSDHMTAGRAYQVTDLPLIQTLGITAGYLSALVLALYLNSEDVVKLYATPAIIWAAIPTHLFWISWMWMQAQRGNMHDDPLIFALKNKTSLLTGLVLATMMTLGALDVSCS